MNRPGPTALSIRLSSVKSAAREGGVVLRQRGPYLRHEGARWPLAAHDHFEGAPIAELPTVEVHFIALSLLQ